MKIKALACLCIMYGANRIPLERKSLWDFPMIRFHFEYKCRFLFIANIHSIISKSLACGCMMRMREPDIFGGGIQVDYESNTSERKN